MTTRTELFRTKLVEKAKTKFSIYLDNGYENRTIRLYANLLSDLCLWRMIGNLSQPAVVTSSTDNLSNSEAKDLSHYSNFQQFEFFPGIVKSNFFVYAFEYCVFLIIGSQPIVWAICLDIQYDKSKKILSEPEIIWKLLPCYKTTYQCIIPIFGQDFTLTCHHTKDDAYIKEILKKTSNTILSGVPLESSEIKVSLIKGLDRFTESRTDITECYDQILEKSKLYSYVSFKGMYREAIDISPEVCVYLQLTGGTDWIAVRTFNYMDGHTYKHKFGWALIRCYGETFLPSAKTYSAQCDNCLQIYHTYNYIETIFCQATKLLSEDMMV